jgi:hypothetical protein
MPSWLTELRRLAQAATPGPWGVFGGHVNAARGDVVWGHPYSLTSWTNAAGEENGDALEADLHYLAALSPARVLALVEVVEKVRAYLETRPHDEPRDGAGYADWTHRRRALAAYAALNTALAEMDGREGRDAT